MALLQKLRAKCVPGNPYLFVRDRRWKRALALQAAGKWREDMELVCGKAEPWAKIVALAKIKADDARAEFYSLRKTCCCDLLSAGVPAHEVQKLMGHADLTTTLKWYNKVNKADADRRIREAQKQVG
jgi:hypothetical protein